MSLYINFYALQNVPPSNINRDDTGSPKTAIYGGSLRSRVSSQAQKRAIRRYFHDHFSDAHLGHRTKLAVELIADRIKEKKPEMAENAEAWAETVLKATGVKTVSSSRKGEKQGSIATQYLIFIAQTEINELADLAIKWAEEGKNSLNAAMKKEVKAVFHGSQAIDIALFGRMLADAPDLGTDASAQVAHAISVDAVSQDFDFYTAVDDEASQDNAGAGMIGTIAFTSSTLYRYANVNISALEEQIGDTAATTQAIAAFTEAFFRSMPTGKQNSFANRTLPAVCLVTIRTDQPINLVDAFEKPVTPTKNESTTERAAHLLGVREQQIDSAYGATPSAAYSVIVGEPIDELNDVSENVTFPTLVENVKQTVQKLIDDKGQDEKAEN